jgi:RNA-directed DNA polymerase
MKLKDGKRQKNQMELAFPREARGEAPEAHGEGTEPPVADHGTESPAYTEQLMEEILERGNMKKALQRVQSNKGAPGVDGMTVGALPAFLRKHWTTIRAQLLNGTYRPQPVRRVEIPKPGGGTRKLGIPTALDRLIQQAALQVLQEQWDRSFSKHSYGFRPGRSAHQAVAQAQEYVRQGYAVVADLDLEQFFDRVQHDRLMSRIAQRVADKRVLKLIRAFLKAGVMEHGLVGPTEIGTPQGGPLSPLLSNLVLDELDRELERRGLRFCRYADDCNVYVRSERAGLRVMASLTRFIERKLRLRVNQTKSAVAWAWERQFLGFSVTKGYGHKRRVSPKAIRRFKARVREITKRNRGVSLPRVVTELNRYLRGWLGYYDSCEARYVLRDLDSWIRRRLRCFIWKKWKTFKRRRRGLMERGIAEAPASQTAARSRGCWSTSDVPPLRQAFPKAYFDTLGLIRMFAR